MGKRSVSQTGRGDFRCVPFQGVGSLAALQPRSESMRQCLLLPDRRNHTIQKVRIGSHRVLYLAVHDDPHPAEVFSWSKVPASPTTVGAVRRHCPPPTERVPSVRVFPLSSCTRDQICAIGVIDVLDSWIARDSGARGHCAPEKRRRYGRTPRVHGRLTNTPCSC
jgi:hypothetical protein